MDLRPSLQLPAMIKAMTDVVIPALEPGNRMAQEQARLIVGMLGLMAARLPLMFAYDRDELERYLSLSDTLLKHVNGKASALAAAKELDASAAHGAEVLDRARAEPGELEAAVLSLRAKVSALVRSVYDEGEPAIRGAVSRAVLSASKDQLDRERSWLIPQGWEADPSALTPIEKLIGGSRSGT
jgi:predicted nuclease with TOPRIM domain